MLLLKKVVLAVFACCLTVVSGADRRFLSGGSGVHLFAGGSSGHGGISYSSGGGGGSYSGYKVNGLRPPGNGGGGSYPGNGGSGNYPGNGGSGGRPAGIGGIGGSYPGNGGSVSNSVGNGIGGNYGGILGGGVSPGQLGGYEEESNPPRPYNFSYAVKDRHSGVKFAHSEQSDGENVRGEFRVRLPDGRTQLVTYIANWRTGFKADVHYEGDARYPQQSLNNGFGWPSSGNEQPFSGNREPFGGNNIGAPINNGPSSGNGQFSSRHGQPFGSNGGHSQGPYLSNGPFDRYSGYGK